MSVRQLPRVAPEVRFFLKVNQSDHCWVWSGARNPAGYGVFNDGGARLAHRWAYEFLVGPIPDGLTLDHLCRNRQCVNPDHLDPCPAVVNASRAPRVPRPKLLVCKRGLHLMDDANTLRRPSRRATECRACANEMKRARRERTGRR